METKLTLFASIVAGYNLGGNPQMLAIAYTLAVLAFAGLFWAYMDETLSRLTPSFPAERRALIERRIARRGSPPPLVERRRGQRRRLAA
jgi:peptidoglycan/LPS O-acetylase OafA/YrhL